MSLANKIKKWWSKPSPNSALDATDPGAINNHMDQLVEKQREKRHQKREEYRNSFKSVSLPRINAIAEIVALAYAVQPDVADEQIGQMLYRAGLDGVNGERLDEPKDFARFKTSMLDYGELAHRVQTNTQFVEKRYGEQVDVVLEQLAKAGKKLSEANDKVDKLHRESCDLAEQLGKRAEQYYESEDQRKELEVKLKDAQHSLKAAQDAHTQALADLNSRNKSIERLTDDLNAAKQEIANWKVWSDEATRNHQAHNDENNRIIEELRAALAQHKSKSDDKGDESDDLSALPEAPSTIIEQGNTSGLDVVYHRYWVGKPLHDYVSALLVAAVKDCPQIEAIQNFICGLSRDEVQAIRRCFHKTAVNFSQDIVKVLTHCAAVNPEFKANPTMLDVSASQVYKTLGVRHGLLTSIFSLMPGRKRRADAQATIDKLGLMFSDLRHAAQEGNALTSKPAKDLAQSYGLSAITVEHYVYLVLLYRDSSYEGGIIL